MSSTVQIYTKAKRALIEANRAQVREFNKFGLKYELNRLDEKLTPEENSYVNCHNCHPYDKPEAWDTSEAGLVLHLVMCM